MNVYTFVFILGLANIITPFLGFPYAFKKYALVTLGVIALLYALYMRTLQKEREAGITAPAAKRTPQKTQQRTPRTIEQVVEMEQVQEKIIVSDVKPKRRGRRPKVAAHEQMYE